MPPDPPRRLWALTTAVVALQKPVTIFSGAATVLCTDMSETAIKIEVFHSRHNRGLVRTNDAL